MEKLNKKNLLLQLKSLTVFKNLLKTDLFVGLAKFLASENLEEEIENYIAETRNYDVVLHVKPEKANKIHASMIDGKKCIVIPMEENEQATINGVNTTL